VHRPLQWTGRQIQSELAIHLQRSVCLSINKLPSSSSKARVLISRLTAGRLLAFPVAHGRHCPATARAPAPVHGLSATAKGVTRKSRSPCDVRASMVLVGCCDTCLHVASIPRDGEASGRSLSRLFVLTNSLLNSTSRKVTRTTCQKVDSLLTHFVST
jgi:hypothetical protein